MDSADVSLIRPVQGLKKAADVTVDERRERQRRHSENTPSEDGAFQEADDEKLKTTDDRKTQQDDDPHTVDFCA